MEKINKIGLLALGDKSDGGVYQYTLSILNLAKNDNTTEFILFCYEDNVYTGFEFETRIIPSIYKKFNYKLILLLLLFFKFKFKKFKFKNLFHDVNVLYCSTISFFPIYFLDIPYVFTLHDLQEKYLPENFNFKEIFLRNLINKRLLKYSKKIICESYSVKLDIIKYYKINENKINVLASPPTPIFLNFKLDEKKWEIFKDSFNIPDSYIFYPAQFWLHKNHDNLLKAFKLISDKYQNINLVLCGGKKNNFDKISELIKNLKLEKRVLSLGYVDSENLPYLYKKSLFLIMPSLFESISIPIYEAYALKIPVCCSNLESMELQIENSAIIFNPYDIKDIAYKMESLLSNKSLRDIFASKGYNKLKAFNPQKFSAEFKSVLLLN